MGFLRDTLGLRRTEDDPESDFNSDLFQTQVSEFWSNLSSTGVVASPRLVDRVWVANRCQHMNSTAISTMPLRYFGGAREPAWVANPDPAWFPNGIGDAIYAIVWSMYGWGDAFVYITDRYNTGYPSAWTVLDPAPMNVSVVEGTRRYRSGSVTLNPNNMVQISRDPRGGVRGTSAIASFGAYLNGLLAAADLGRVMMGSGATPNAVIKSTKKLGPGQAEVIQEKWMTATAARRGAPAVLGPDLNFEQLAFSPADLLLLDAQKFDAQVIAAAYGVPAQMVNLPLEGGLNYQTPVLMLEQWWRTELRTTAGRVQRALSANMLPRDNWVSFDAREFLAPTFTELVEAFAKLVEVGAVDLNELRAVVLNLPPQEVQQALEDLVTPPSAGASPAQQPPNVTALRPTSTVSSNSSASL